MKRNRLPRGRRGFVASLVALLIVALAVLGSIAAFQIHGGHTRTVLGSVPWVAERLRTRDWTDVGALIAGIVLAAIGFVLLVAGLLPARRRLLRLADLDPNTVSGMSRVGMSRDLSAVASQVDGVAAARVKVRRRRARVKARSPLRDISGVREAVEFAVRGRIATLDPSRTMSVRARIRPGGG